MTKIFNAEILGSDTNRAELAKKAIKLVNKRMELAEAILFSNPFTELSDQQKKVLEHDAWVQENCINYFNEILRNEVDGEDVLRLKKYSEIHLIKFSIKKFSQYLDCGFRIPLPKEKEQIDNEIRKVCVDFIESKNPKVAVSGKLSR